MSRELKTWVSDQLHTLVGFSEANLADYVCGLANKQRSAQGLLTALHEADVPDNAATRRFASELWSRVPRQKAASADKARDKETIALNKHNDSYRPVEADGADEADEVTAAVQQALAAKEKERRRSEKHERKRQRADDKEEKREREKAAAPLDPEEARAQDIRERDELAERLRMRDLANTKTLRGPEAAAQEARQGDSQRLLAADTADDKAELLDELRRAARHKYLAEREKKMLEAARDDLADEKFLWNEGELTEREIAENRHKEKLYDLANQRVNISDKVDGYKMPTAYDEEGNTDQNKRFEPLMARYQEEEGEELTEYQAWDANQIKRSTARVGAQDRKGKTQIGGVREEDYGLVMATDEQIEFISDEIVSGNLQAEESKVAAPTVKQTLAEVRKSLPVFPYREQIIEAVNEYQVLIIVGETGSGKTTQIPQYLHEAGYTADNKKVGCTQPRRVAAMSVASRVAQEVGTKLGNEVGYAIRFEDCTSERTVLKYMTDGMLLREFLGEPDLASYSAIILDEAHERTLHTDILFGLLKDIARFRPELKLLVSSATLDAAKFSGYFDDAPVFNIPGRRYPVDIMYTKAPEADYVEAAVVTTLQIHITQPLPGDILIFFTGQDEIESALETLQHRTRGFGTKIPELLVLPIYANLPSDMQAKIFEPTPPGARKVVLATNIAETSITIDNIVYVIDPGFAKQNSYNPKTGMESLIVTPVAKASANQRAGRAGRVAPGKCFRLYTKWAYLNELDDNTIPEIQRTNLGSVVLMLKSLGINDLIHFDFMDPPPAETLIRALEQLYALSALNDRGELTKMGRRMAEFPMDPQLSKMLIKAAEYGVSTEILSICGMLQIGASVFYRPKERALHADNARINFHKPGGDHMTLLHVWNCWAETQFSTQWCFENFIQVRSMRKARDIREQLESMMERVEVDLVSNVGDVDAICKAITAGFFYHTAKLQKSLDYRTVKHPQTVHIHPSSSLHQSQPRWVVYHELVFTTKEFMRQIVEIKPEWLCEIAPHYYKKNDVEDDAGKKLPKMGMGKAGGSRVVERGLIEGAEHRAAAPG
jgi:pre-mRNA-splicing factor ATP-dependent RNA helicase DHX16